MLRNDAERESSELTMKFGPDLEIPINYQQLSFGFILSQLLPVPAPSAYEQIGHVAHFNLKSDHLPYGELIGQVLRETNPSIDTVVSKVGEVKGKYRTYDLEVLAGPANFDTTVVEHGLSIRLNVADCYWSTRLSGERQELIQDIVRSIARSKKKDLVVADVFCGVGAVCLLLAKSNPQFTILANDWNPRAIEYLKESIALNGMEGTNQFQLSCGDAYDYLIDLCTDRPYTMIPDHVLMNYPLEAPTFLGALRWWSSRLVEEKFRQTRRYPRFHVYTFARPSGKDLDDEEDVAVDLVANELLPAMDLHDSRASNEFEGENDKESWNTHRRKELSEEFGAEVQTRMVRDVAPGKVVVCVSFSLTPKLIRYIQGDYI
jgi:tRNA (guanine37-N1)-methyltransferase